ncbi:unnamed protein product, partial [Didymodactylos carnosus]
GNGSSSSQPSATMSVIDRQWELIDPTPKIQELFVQFNQQFFYDQLGAVYVEWSKRMTSCAGICYYERRGHHCRIALSEPLLKLRPRKDLVQTLLHEMIHAYLFVTKNNRVYHNFIEEFHHLRQHWWRCNGKCQQWAPYFGYVKRAMNRAPSKNDFWFATHQERCGGEFIKVKEPEPKEKRKNMSTIDSSSASKKLKPLLAGQRRLDSFIIKPKVQCPVCDQSIDERESSAHVNQCLNETTLSKGATSSQTSITQSQPTIVIDKNSIQCEYCSSTMIKQNLQLHLLRCKNRPR